jgi:hypothetical protein
MLQSEASYIPLSLRGSVGYGKLQHTSTAEDSSILVLKYHILFYSGRGGAEVSVG